MRSRWREVKYVGIIAPLIAALIVAPFHEAQAKRPSSAGDLVANVTGTVSGYLNEDPAQIVPAGSTFVGTFTVTSFQAVNDQIVATGTLAGTVQDSAGNVLDSVTETVTMPAQLTSGSCEILELVLGPLHLDLLGLVIDLNQVELTITAEQGPGNLLGNLLCAVANLLNPGGGGGIGTALQQIINLLNQILGAL